MSKSLIHPSDLRAGLADIEMADETVDLVYKNLSEGQAHLQGEPFDIKDLPEGVSKLQISDNVRSDTSPNEYSDEDDEEGEDEYEEVYDPVSAFQDFLDETGSYLISKLKKGEKIKKTWSEVSRVIYSYVMSNFPPRPPKPTTKDIAVQADLKKPNEIQKISEHKSKSEPSPREPVVEMHKHATLENPEDDEGALESEIAHQVAESYSKKYKFPSKSSGIFLWNFEQLKMNLDDIVQVARGVPGISQIVERGGKLPLRCMLGYVGLETSKRFRSLVNQDKLCKLMQEDLNAYSVSSNN
ncbi:phosphoprotein [Lyssavirus caucasicus]|uniref:Phosphoprotein n=2 Tax=West Caucasian bat virus TaxID=249584 RepID=PHOSP_WCBV|nr:phosphoprotein [Lyssavirus caucasicus]Q5VKP1.1 RecName: Full=Phosphoprotein; Short=Protein P; AltName: Full=Protein M1 [Lyssavirus caucasicus]AAR03482.1 phosphoprotein [Lyssavirus caucasicus]